MKTILKLLYQTYMKSIKYRVPVMHLCLLELSMRHCISVYIYIYTREILSELINNDNDNVIKEKIRMLFK